MRYASGMQQPTCPSARLGAPGGGGGAGFKGYKAIYSPDGTTFACRGSGGVILWRLEPLPSPIIFTPTEVDDQTFTVGTPSLSLCRLLPAEQPLTRIASPHFPMDYSLIRRRGCCREHPLHLWTQPLSPTPLQMLPAELPI